MGDSSISSSLLVRARAKDPEAWRKLVRLYGPTVFGWCRHWGVPAHDTPDVVQEVFQAVAEGLAEFHRDRSGDTFRGWVCRISRNKSAAYWRRRGKEPGLLGGSEAMDRLAEIPAEDEESQDNPVSAEESSELFQRALQLIRTDFHENTWRAFWRITVDGAKPSDVADDLSMSVGAVYVAKSRVLGRLRTEFAELLE